MRAALILALMFLASPAMAQDRPIPIPLQMLCSPVEAWARGEKMRGILGGIDGSGDIWNVYASDEGFNILVTFKGMICLVGSGREVGDHLIMPIPIKQKGKAS